MHSYIEILIVLPVLVLCFQFYFFSVNCEGVMRQERCQRLGVAFMTIGIVALVFKSAVTAFFGLIMMMFGFRLIARGLDRLDKTKVITHYEDDKEV